MPTRTSPPGLPATAAFIATSLAACAASATDYYVAATGSDANAGTLAAPFATLQKGHDAASAGDTVWIRGGTYKVNKQIKLSKSGQSDAQRIKFFAYEQEKPLIDFSGYVTANAAVDTPAFLVTGNWLHLRGLELANVPVGKSGDHSISTLRSEGASNNTYERLDIHHGFGPGLFISKGTGGNLILNVDSHDNYDKDGSQGDGQNGDGFGVHYQTTGPSTIIRGCRAWVNSDDGYDLISQEVPVIIENSWAMTNGFSNGGAGKPSSGNGNGFKAGSSDTGIRHILRFNVAWKNRAAGFYANHSTGGNTWLNNTAYNNAVQYNMLASPVGDPDTTITLTGALAHKMRNNVGFPNKNTNMSGVDTMFNTWDLNITEAATDFVSTSDAGATGPRQADGSLPAIDFLKLKAGSPLVDKGTDVMLPYEGKAPDLGADEFGAMKPSTGGSGGSQQGGAGGGGSGGTGGTTAGGSSNTAGASGDPVTGGVGGVAAAGSPSAGAPAGRGGSSVSTAGSGTAAPGGSSTASPTAGGSSVSGAGSATGEAREADGGCSCALGQNTTGTAGLVAAVLAGMLGARRRRRPNA